MSSIGTGVSRTVYVKQLTRDVYLAVCSYQVFNTLPPTTQYDLSAAQFSPDGRVFQIEYASKAVENSGYVS